MTRLFVRQLTVIDCSYLDAVRGLVGESWILDLELSGGLDEQGMVLDFGDIKRSVKRLIDDRFDHKLLVPGEVTGLAMESSAQGVELTLPLSGGGIVRHASPRDAVTVLPMSRVDPQPLAREIERSIQPALPGNVERVAIDLRIERIDGACYQYSHGLKQHDGNCQRIAHGHRSRLELSREGRYDEAASLAWAERWRDIYVGTREDLLGETEHGGVPHLRFGYEARQGHFELELPRDRCYLIDTDSTVENIAQHIADEQARKEPGRWLVRAFEGVDKGAIGEV